jgi:hypothetical protein
MKRLAAELGWPSLGTALALCIAGLYPIDNPDTFGHLAAGRQIVELGHVPKLDSFSYFRPQPATWVNYEWLSDLLFYLTYRAGGYAGLSALKLVLLGTLAALLIAIGRARAGRLGATLTTWIVIADLPGLRFRLSVRPHLFGLVFGALYLLGLCRILQPESRRKVWLWVAGLALAHVAWVNLHGSHLLGLALCGLAWLSAVRRTESRAPLSVLLGLLLLASCVSPYGPAIVSGALAHALDPAYRDVIEEWQAWRPSQPIAYPLLVAWQALWLAIAMRSMPRDALRVFSLASALLLLLMAARSLRFIPDFLALTAPAIAAGLAQPLAAWPAPRRRTWLIAGGASVSLLALVLCLQLPPGRAFGWSESTRGRPAASSAWLGKHLPDARIMAVMSDAWDLMFSLPRAQFLIDGRTPFYGPAQVRRVQRAWGSGDALRTLLNLTGTDVVIAQPLVSEQQPALRALLGFVDFRLVMIEAQHCVFARMTEAHAPNVEPAALRVLQPGYAVDWVLTGDAEAIRRELDALEPHPNVVAYRSWVLGLLAAKPLLRAGGTAGNAGIAAPQTAQQRTAAVQALGYMRTADDGLPDVPSVMAYRALLAIATCRLDEARAVLARAEAQGEARELLLGRQELALRAGDAGRVRTFLAQARALPDAKGDPWIEALQAQLESAPVCATDPSP